MATRESIEADAAAKGMQPAADRAGPRPMLPNAIGNTPRQAAQRQAIAALLGGPVVQMVRYIRKRTGQIVEVPDGYEKKSNERWASEEDFLSRTGGSEVAEAKRQAIRDRQEQERQQAEQERQRLALEKRKQERRAHRAHVTPGQMPKPHEGKQTRFPGVVKSADNSPAELDYRGMSINNILNLQRGHDAVFTAQDPTGTATPLAHVVDDSETSPYLSFELGGLDISAGKYAPKPVDADNKPLEVTQKPGGFLKQEKSYTSASRQRNPDAKRIGYVGGITRDSGTERLDVSDESKAQSVFSTTPGETTARKEKAVTLAKADKEVLVKPGTSGITADKVPFVTKVKEVDEAYYRKHAARQTPQKALGYYKAYGEEPTYVKLQVRGGPGAYKFNTPADLQRADDDSEAEMSDIEDINLDDY
ncbi:MAG: hypothetical protein ACOZJX_00560 [Pseudomonadota bacterium]